MKNLPEFLWAVFRRWRTLVTGVTLTLIFGGIEHFKQASLSWKAYCLILAVTFLAACFGAWKEEREKLDSKTQELEELEKRLSFPEFVSTPGSVSHGPMGTRTVITFFAHIANPFGPQSSLYGWQMHLEFADKRIVRQSSPIFPNPNGVNMSLGNTGKSVLLKTSAFLPSLTAPVPPGGFIEGWFWATFEGITEANLYEDRALVVLTFRDAVSGKEHRLTQTFKTRGVNLPGVTDTDWIPK
jgi:hypothetical protein